MTPDQLAKRLSPANFKQRKIVLLERLVLIGEEKVKRRTLVKQGTLRRSIVGRVRNPGERGVVGTNLSYAQHVHEGTKPHTIVGSPWLFWPGASHPVRSVRHPGTKAQPFLIWGLEDARPQMEKEAERAGEEFFSS